MRFLTLDWYYPEAYEAAKRHPGGIFDFCHGTSDYMDICLRAAGHEAMTIVVNGDPHWQVHVAEYKPTHIISQNVGMWGAYEGSPLSEMRRFAGCKLIGFCSYKAADQTLLGWDALFSSFPWMSDHCKSIGVRCEYLPLAFGKQVLRRLGEDPIERDIPVAFVGGLGNSIWSKGTTDMAAIADAIPEFRWWGYKVGVLPPSLERSHQGTAWGIDYYKLLHRIRILVNRHGEIAKGFANNMREFEGRGCGCFVASDCHGVFGKNWPSDWSNILMRIAQKEHTATMAHDQQQDVLDCHCYENRVPEFLKVMESL
jgi:hypothetical protein